MLGNDVVCIKTRSIKSGFWSSVCEVMKKQIHGERWWVVWFSTIQLFRWIPFRNRHPISRASIFPPPSRVPYRFLHVQCPELQWIVGTELEKNRTSLIIRLTLSLGSTPLAQLPSSRLLSEPKYDKNSRIVWYNLFGYREMEEKERIF